VIFHSRPAFDAPVKVERRMMVVIFGIKVARCLCYNVVQNIDEKFNHMSRVYHRHRRRTDRQTTDGIAIRRT